LLTFIILPRRPHQSAEAYRKIWTERGSPLLFHGEDLVRGVQKTLGDGFVVALGMRYQKPSLAGALQTLRQAGCHEIVAFPLFPQYSSAAWGSAVERLFQVAGPAWNVPAISLIPPFYDHPLFISAFAEVARPVLDEVRPDHVLMSFHGLPERHVKKSDEATPPRCLMSEGCCDTIGSGNRYCYRAQCFATARALAARLNLGEDQMTVCFQSRLGRDPWLKPATDVLVPQLAKAGKKRLAVLSPAFVADCLETLEEIALRARADFVAAGGDTLVLVPSLNSHPAWVAGVAQLIRERCDERSEGRHTEPAFPVQRASSP
jgi:ferrochelatase